MVEHREQLERYEEQNRVLERDVERVNERNRLKEQVSAGPYSGSSSYIYISKNDMRCGCFTCSHGLLAGFYKTLRHGRG